MEAAITIESVKTFETRSGNARYVIRDTDGNEYTTFRERIGGRAAQLEGQRARIEYHEEQRDQYTNVYLCRPGPERRRAQTPIRRRPRGGPPSKRRRGWWV